MTLSEKILYCRKRCALSQEVLAEKIGVSRQAISKWETGEAAPELSKLALLAKTFGVTADWLISEDNPPESAAQGASQKQPAAPRTKRKLGGFFARRGAKPCASLWLACRRVYCRQRRGNNDYRHYRADCGGQNDERLWQHESFRRRLQLRQHLRQLCPKQPGKRDGNHNDYHRHNNPHCGHRACALS